MWYQAFWNVFGCREGNWKLRTPKHTQRSPTYSWMYVLIYSFICGDVISNLLRSIAGVVHVYSDVNTHVALSWPWEVSEMEIYVKQKALYADATIELVTRFSRNPNMIQRPDVIHALKSINSEVVFCRKLSDLPLVCIHWFEWDQSSLTMRGKLKITNQFFQPSTNITFCRKSPLSNYRWGTSDNRLCSG